MVDSSIEQFLASAHIGNDGTRRAYRAALTAWAQFATQPITVERILAWPAWLIATRRIGQRTLHLYLAALQSYLRYLQINDELTITPGQAARLTDGLRHIRRAHHPPAGSPHPITDDQMTAILHTINRFPPGPTPRLELIRQRDRAIILTLRCTGLRLGELVALRRTNLHNSLGHIIGKGRRERTIYFDTASWTAITAYLAARDAGAADFVFIRHNRNAGPPLPLSTAAGWRIVQRVIAASGLTHTAITPHSFRHYVATKLYQATGDLGLTQTALGHSSPATTRIYAQLDDNAIRTAHAKVFS